MCRRRLERGGRRFWERFHMRESRARDENKSRSLAPELWSEKNGRRGLSSLRVAGVTSVGLLRPLFLAFLCSFLSCSKAPDANTFVMIIESSPTNLDPRVGVDAQSERIDELIFDSLLTRDEHFNVRPGLAERWEVPDALTYVFHLRNGVKFHDGRLLTSRDVKWTLDSLLERKVRSTRAATFRYVDHVDAPDEYTVIFHLKEPFASLLWNLSEGAIGIVPYGALGEMAQRPIGSGPFRFVSAEQDQDVVLERNDNYWGEKARLARVRFTVVPDTTTRALELRKGSADAAINALTSDIVVALEKDPKLKVEEAPGTILAYLSFNMRDPVLRDFRVRQAIACAIDRKPLIDYLWRGFAQAATNLIPVQSWAYDADVKSLPYDPERARRILDAAGYPEHDGVRFHLTMKTSTEETTRLLAAVLQQQLRAVGIVLDIRTYEFATFLADVSSGAFQVYSLRWSGNEDPDIFDTAFHSHNFPPAGRNRGYYSNPKVDELIDEARRETDQNARRELYFKVQEILAREVPYVDLWYFDNVLVHTRRVSHLSLTPSGNYDFLRTAEIINP
jgi:peptide/nickel transport system substrate-binding protein